MVAKSRTKWTVRLVVLLNIMPQMLFGGLFMRLGDTDIVRLRNSGLKFPQRKGAEAEKTMFGVPGP